VEFYTTEIDSIDFLDTFEESSAMDAKPSTMFLRAASPIEYNFTTHEKEFLKNDGFCVEDNLLGIYSPLIKSFTLKNIIDIASKFYEDLNITWDNTMGYTTDCIMHICKFFNISAYAFDIMNNCFSKHITEWRNYPALYFFAMNNHMYLVKNTDQCKSLCERAKDTTVSFKTSLIDEAETKNLFEELPIYENVMDVSTITGYDSSIFIYSREYCDIKNINDIFHQCLALYGVPKNKTLKATKSNIVRFEYTINKTKYIFVQDPNDIDIINWRKVQELCKDNDIPFKNQTFLAFIKEVRTKLINKKSERHTFTEEEKRHIYDNIAMGKCAICDEKLQRKYEVDHIKPLASGGTNDTDNIQLLCKSCHKEKSQREKEDGSYVRIIDTESSFNNQVLDIMNSEHSHRYAFIEHVEPLDQDEDKYKCLDVLEETNDKSNEQVLLEREKEELQDRIDKYVNKFKWIPAKEIDERYGAQIKELDDKINECKNKKIEPKIKDVSPDDIYDEMNYNTAINKCPKNNLYYSEYDLPVFTVMDKVKIFNKDKDELKTGIYYVETTAYFPLRGNGWYSLPMIDYCLENNIIELENIKYCVQCLVSIPANYYNEFIDYCYDTLPEDYKKLSINMMIGGFKPNLNKNVNWSSVCITSNSCEAYHQYLQNNGCFIEVITVNNIKYFHVYKEIQRTNMETEKPIYDQILDLEAIALHKLTTVIESKGGEVLDLNTDCATCIFKNVFPFELDNNNIKGYYYDKENKVPLYKLEDKHTRLQIERMPLYSRNKTYEYEYFKWQVADDVEDNDFKPLVDTVINSNKSYFITGPAGTGKSQLIRDIKDQLDKNGKSYKCLAPTNLAALNIKGSTIHKFVSKIKKMDSIYKINLDYIFIDEISMVKEVFYKFFVMLKRIKSNTIFIIAGDFNQLPPINDRIQENIDYEFDYKNSLALKELCDFNMLQLSKCRRSDDILYNMCKFENINDIDTSLFGSEYTMRHLAFTNKKRIDINKKCMDIDKTKYHGKKYILEANSNDANSQEITLYPKLPIICKKNDEPQGLINNEQFIVSKLTSTSVYVKNEEKELEIEMNKFQEFFYVAYCITIHKSQGASFNFPYTIHEFNRLNKKLRYVALTRATDKKFINIISH
jgi:DNA replication protein DnaC